MSRLEQLRALLVDADRVSVRIVTTAERIVVKEAKRAYAWLHLYGYQVDAVVANRLYPDDALAGYFERWTELQRTSLAEIEEGFAGLPVLKLMLRHGELRGLAGLRAAADDLYGDVDPERVLVRDRPAAFRPERVLVRDRPAAFRECDGAWELVLPAPASTNATSPSAKTATPSSCP
ncbi:ArsA family ATPase [Eggerthella sinensis]|uniref:ArsA family ATPase n=1 Tax=Eggerthella sinensis TaxID=242230 RepID=UPI0022E8CFB9|nr:ArsA-related P-loop ATPase [Eggerthella sinensis]